MPITNMRPKVKIITHAGRAHRDDFLATCWLIANIGTCEVYRTEPTADDLADSELYVVDCGGEYDPVFNNYDHHQFAEDHEPTCALQLLLENDLGRAQAHQVFPWLMATGVVDSKGPKVASTLYEVPIETFTKFGSPIELAMLELFSDVDHLDDTDILFHTMKAIGFSMVDRAAMLGAMIDSVKLSTVVSASGLRVLICTTPVSDMPAPRYLPEVMEIKRRALAATDWHADMSISPNTDSRGPSWVLYRYDDSGKVNFNRIRNLPGVTFVHANGFIAKIAPDASPAYLLELASKSLTPSVQ